MYLEDFFLRKIVTWRGWLYDAIETSYRLMNGIFSVSPKWKRSGECRSPLSSSLSSGNLTIVCVSPYNIRYMLNCSS